MDTFLIPFFSIIFLIAFYPPLMLYVALVAGVGIFTWLIFALMPSPHVVVWYCVAARRERNYLKLLVKPLEWNISKTLDEYEESLKKHR